MEFMTYRYRGHVGPDDNIQGLHTDIRPREEVEQWLARDPITTFECFLLDNGVLDEATLGHIKDDVRVEVEEAHTFASESPSPEESELSKYVFKEK